MSFDYKRLRTDAKYRAELTDWVSEDDDLRDEGRHLAKTNLLALCWILGYTKVDPLIHKEALEFFIPRDLTKGVDEQGSRPGLKTRGDLLYPRGSYKTTIDEADSVQEVICFPLTCNLFFLCANEKLAWALVSNVGQHFIKRRQASGTLFQNLFPELCVSDPKAADGGRFSPAVRQQSPPIKEAAIMGWSVESGVSGWHCWRLKCDDIANNRNMKNETTQAEVFRNYRINRKMLNPGGIEDRLGTRYGPNDPYGLELANSRPGSRRYVIKPALRLKSGERLDANGFPEPEEMDLLFEGLGLTYDVLRDEYEADYSSFMTQYMNDAFGSHEVTFGPELLQNCFQPAETMPMDGVLAIRWRLPNSAAGWKHAAALVGVSNGLRMHVIDGVHVSLTPSVLAMRVVTLAKDHDLNEVTIEDSPGARKLGPAIQNYAATLGYTLYLHWSPRAEAEAELDQRIRALEPIMVGGRLVFSEALRISKRVFEQFSLYGISTDNALPDLASRLCEMLPASILRPEDEIEDADLAYQMASQRDRYNMLYGMGAYARREAEPVAVQIEASEPARVNPYGLDDIMPGLNG